jgi:hypothetical protein
VLHGLNARDSGLGRLTLPGASCFTALCGHVCPSYRRSTGVWRLHPSDGDVTTSLEQDVAGCIRVSDQLLDSPPRVSARLGVSVRGAHGAVCDGGRPCPPNARHVLPRRDADFQMETRPHNVPSASVRSVKAGQGGRAARPATPSPGRRPAAIRAAAGPYQRNVRSRGTGAPPDPSRPVPHRLPRTAPSRMSGQKKGHRRRPSPCRADLDDRRLLVLRAAGCGSGAASAGCSQPCPSRGLQPWPRAFSAHSAAATAVRV